MFDLISKSWEGVVNSVSGLYQVSRGLWTVFDHSFREPITEHYPDVPPEVPVHFRGRLALTVNPDTGENLCISCRQCERVCPDKCIEITAHKSPETNKLELIDFKIDHGLCMFCGLCTEVCPTSCIINTTDFEMADYTRQSLIYDIKKLTLGRDESAFYFEKKEMPLPKPKPAKAAPKPAAAAGDAKPAAPAGEAKPAATAAGDATPAAEAKSAAEAKPAPEVKPAAESKPTPEVKPAVPSEAKPAPEAKPATEEKPAAEEKPKQDSESAKPDEEQKK
jgi:NADH-quinone oxidoreductase subunit I